MPIKKKAAAPKVEENNYADGKWAAAFAPRAPGEVRHWLVKSEADVFSFDDLVAAPKKTTQWDGVRNFVARNFLRDGMKRGDLVFYYHSGAGAQEIVGVCEVVREGYPDPTALDASHAHHDAKSDPASPSWFMVDLRAVERVAHPVTLAQIKARKELADMTLVRIGRLSVSPVTSREWAVIMSMTKAKPGKPGNP